MYILTTNFVYLMRKITFFQFGFPSFPYNSVNAKPASGGRIDRPPTSTQI